MARITKDPDERRGELVASAQKLFFSKGYGKTSINDIVKDVGVAKGLFYYYFDSKQAILEEMAEMLAQQAIGVMHVIVSDDSLPALEKWSRAFLVTSAWKTARKDELKAMLIMLRRDDNAVMHQRIRARALQRTAPEIAKIVQQGVDEGVFETEYVAESTEICLSIMNSINDALSDILLNPDKYDDGAAVVRQKINAIQTAVERVLGAPAGALPLIDDAIIDTWFN